MSEMTNIVENGLKTGKNVYLTYKENSDSKYHVLCMFKEIVPVKGDATTVDYRNTSQAYASKVTTGYSIDEADYEFAATRDNFHKMKVLTGKNLSFMIIDTDTFIGFKFTGTMTYKSGTASGEDVYMGTMHVVPLSSEETHTEDAFDLFEDSVFFDGSANPQNEVLSITTYGSAGKVYDIVTKPVDATLSVDSSSDSVATVTVAGTKVTITPVAKGSAVITIKGTKADYGDAEHGVHVIVTD